MTLQDATQLNLKRTDFIFHKPSGQIYHFGYISGMGYLVCYSPGEENGQDAYALTPEDCELVLSTKKDLIDLANRN